MAVLHPGVLKERSVFLDLRPDDSASYERAGRPLPGAASVSMTGTWTVEGDVVVLTSVPGGDRRYFARDTEQRLHELARQDDAVTLVLAREETSKAAPVPTLQSLARTLRAATARLGGEWQAAEKTADELDLAAWTALGEGENAPQALRDERHAFLTKSIGRTHAWSVHREGVVMRLTAWEAATPVLANLVVVVLASMDGTEPVGAGSMYEHTGYHVWRSAEGDTIRHVSPVGRYVLALAVETSPGAKFHEQDIVAGDLFDHSRGTLSLLLPSPSREALAGPYQLDLEATVHHRARVTRLELGEDFVDREADQEWLRGVEARLSLGPMEATWTFLDGGKEDTAAGKEVRTQWFLEGDVVVLLGAGDAEPLRFGVDGNAVVALGGGNLVLSRVAKPK